MSLKDTLNELAQKFAADVVEAIRHASLHDLLEDRASVAAVATRAVFTGAVRPPRSKPAKGGRLPRRSKEDIALEIAKVAALLKKEALRSEQIQKALGLDKRELPRVLREGVASGALKVVSGQKRSTVYGVGKADGGSKPKAKTTKKPARSSKKAPPKKKVTKSKRGRK